MWVHGCNSISFISSEFAHICFAQSILLHFIEYLPHKYTIWCIGIWDLSKNLIPSRVRVRLICLFVCLVGRAWLTPDFSYLDQINTQPKTHIQFLFSLYMSNQYWYTLYRKRFWNLNEEGKQMDTLLLGATQAKVRKNKPNYL